MGDTKTDLSASDAFLDRLLAIARAAALSEMGSGVAHELNQPLAAIATYAHAGERMLNRSEPMVEQALEVFRQISHEALAAGERLQAIRQLFDVDRANQQRCQLADLVAEVWPILNTVARRVEAKIAVETPEPVPDVRVDRLRIQHVLLALTQNAADATAGTAGERLITITLRADRYTVETGVTDSGAGVGIDQVEKMFRPFYTTKSTGTGLGLASSRSIIEAHEGTIGFDPAQPMGTRFWFRLPIAQD